MTLDAETYDYKIILKNIMQATTTFGKIFCNR